MPLNLNSPFITRIFAQLQGTDNSSFLAVKNTAGTWNAAGAALIRAGENAVKLTPNMPKNEVNWLTGTRSKQAAVLGRLAASWALNDTDVIPSGAAGTPPDLDPIFQNIFGAAPTVVAATSVTYNFLDSGYQPLTLFRFAHGVSTLTQQVLWGAFTYEARFVFNQNFLRASFSGGAGYLLESDNFASEPTAAKAALTVFPVEPASPTTAGNSLAGFGGTLTIDSQVLETKLLSCELTIRTGFRIIGDLYAGAYGVVAVGGRRACGITLGFLDDDSAQLIDLKQKAKQNASLTGNIVCGTVAGSKVKLTFAGLQLVPQEIQDETDQVKSSFPESLFHASALSLTDDVSLAFL
jgi:hypothetical protein